MKRKMSLEEIHKYEIEMLKVFVSICEKYELRYYLAGGTLLGAIRHKGFIPWDDDIDILMPRSDYDKFLNYAEEIERSKKYRLAAYELGNLNYPFCKIFDIRTSIEKKYIVDSTEQNLWIDILPLDGLPKSSKITARLFRKSLIARRLLKIKKSIIGQGTTWIKKIMKPVVKVFISVIRVQDLVAYINRISRTYSIEDSEYVGGIAMGYGINEKMPKVEFLEPVKVEFESMFLNAPSCWDFYLKSLYGNYMELPPLEKQIAHPMNIWIEEEE